MIPTQKLRAYREGQGVTMAEVGRELRHTRQAIFTLETKTDRALDETAAEYLTAVEAIVARREERDPRPIEIVTYVLIGGETIE